MLLAVLLSLHLRYAMVPRVVHPRLDLCRVSVFFCDVWPKLHP